MTPADMVLYLAHRIAPEGRADWLNAMEAAYQALETGSLRWALGCVAVALGWRVARDGLYAALLCAATWFVSRDPLFVYEAKLIPQELLSFGLNPVLVHLTVICVLLGAYRPRQIVLVSFVLVTAKHLYGLYVWYVVWPREFGDEMGPLWPFLQRLNIMNAHFLIGVWAQLGACFTGGFIGRALVRRLRADGHTVRVLARSPDNAPPEIDVAGVQIVRGDMGDFASVDAALDGIEQVYHLARGDGHTWDDYLRTDVEPTRNLAEAAERHGVKRLHYTSTIAIYYAGRRAGPITEQTPPHPGVVRTNLYSRAKVECERLLLDFSRTHALEVVIFRPGIVLGSGGSPFHWGVGMWPYTSVCRLWGSGNDPLPIVLVDDVADAMARAYGVEGIDGESYNLVGEPVLTAQDYLDELETRSGVHIRRVETSPALYFGEDLAKWVIKSVGRDPRRVTPSYYNWDGRTCAAPFVSAKARQELGWAPEADRDVVVREGIYAPVDELRR